MLDFEIRRERVLNKMEPNSIMIVFGGISKIESEDSSLPFSVNKNFFYLTGIEQEDSILLLIKGFGVKKEYLFVKEYNEIKEKWTGKVITFEHAQNLSGIQNVYGRGSFESMLNIALDNENQQFGKIDNLYLDLSKELKIGDELSTKIFRDNFISKHPDINIINLYPMLTELRMIKSQEEVENIQEAIRITNNGINDLIIALRSGISEQSLSDRFEFYNRSHERTGLAFSTICACGKNGVILHHPVEQQTDIVREGDLVLFDLGYKYNGYSADISRTYPVSGVFTDLQKVIYSIVLECNKKVISMVRPGVTIKQLQEFTLDFFKNECLKNGLMNSEETIYTYYYHNVSHHLGLDTHDVSDREKPLEPGNVITVEPGLYFAKHNIGVRIEDDVLVTNGDPLVLSKDIKKEIEDIQKLFKTRR